MQPAAAPLAVVDAAAPPLAKPKAPPRFPAALTLSPADARRLMSRRHCRVIGILGAPDSGKTAALVSLYLLVAKGALLGWEFADSHSLRTLDDLSQGSRRWAGGGPPDQMTAHTELPDARTPGFIHLRLRRVDGEAVDFLLPDLPGEWSSALIDNNRTDRLGFLASADAIWLMIDGRQLNELKTRHRALHRAKVTLQRVASFIPRPPPIIAVISRRDLGETPQAATDALQAEAARHGLSLQVVPVASFGAGGEVPAGTGIVELIENTLANAGKAPDFWSMAPPPREGRMMMRFGSGEALQ